MLTLCHVHQSFTPLVFSKTEIKAFGEHMVVSLRSSHFCSKVVAMLQGDHQNQHSKSKQCWQFMWPACWLQCEHLGSLKVVNPLTSYELKLSPATG